MQVGVCRVTLRLAENHSLKGKRQVLQSLTSRVRNRYNVSIAEVEDHGSWQLATLGFSCVSNDSRHLQQVMATVVEFIHHQALGHAEVLDYETEVIPF